MRTVTTCHKKKTEPLVIEFDGLDDRDERKKMVAYFGHSHLGALKDGEGIHTLQIMEKGDKVTLTLQSYEESYTLSTVIAKEFDMHEYRAEVALIKAHTDQDEAILMHMVKKGFYELPELPELGFHVDGQYVDKQYEAEEFNKYKTLML